MVNGRERAANKRDQGSSREGGGRVGSLVLEKHRRESAEAEGGLDGVRSY